MVSSVLAFFGGVLAVCSTVTFVAFTIVQEHGGRFLSSGMLLWCHGPTFCLQCTLSFVSVAWRGILVA